MKRMKKSTTLFFVALLASVPTLAQTTIRVQGAPRKVSNAVATRIQKAADATSSTAIDFSKIERWTGSGDCRAALAIKWADGQNDGKTLVWGYRWNSGETKTGEDLIRAVTKADPALYLMADPKNAYGFTIGGIGYDADDDRFVSVTTMEAELYPRNGIVALTSDNYETSAATDWGDGDAWNSGWMSGFWSYYIADNANNALQSAMTGATGRQLTDGCVDAYVFSYFDTEHDANTYDGNIEYLPATTDYTKGTFVLNEGWFGTENASVNFLAEDGTWKYRNTDNIGATGCFATSWGNHYYIMAKQPKDKGAEVSGGRLTICDANSMHVLKQIEEIGGGDGRSFCGIDEHKAYVSTSNGIYDFDIDNMEIGDAVLSTEGECGNMVRLGDYVYAMEYGKNIHVIRCSDNSIVKTIPATAYSIVMSKDGSLWVSTSEGIARINTKSLETEPVSLSEGIMAPATSAGMWNPDGLCASVQRNVILWTSSENWSVNRVFSYDIDKNEAKLLIDYTSDPDSRAIYGASMRVDPKSDCIYTSLVKGWTYNDNIVRKYDADGTQIAEYSMQENYWFPEMFVFADSEDPIVSDINDITVEENNSATVDLTDVVTDADNLQAAIIKSIESVDNEDIASASIEDGKLVVMGLKEGTTNISLKFCSNGITTTKDVAVNVTVATDINKAYTDGNAIEVARFTADGKRIEKAQQGVNIVHYSDGSVKKVVVK